MDAQGHTSHYQESEIHLSDYWRIIKNRRISVLTFFLVTVIAVTTASFLMPPVYRSTVILLIDQEGANVLTASGSLALGSPNYFTYRAGA